MIYQTKPSSAIRVRLTLCICLVIHLSSSVNAALESSASSHASRAASNALAAGALPAVTVDPTLSNSSQFHYDGQVWDVVQPDCGLVDCSANDTGTAASPSQESLRPRAENQSPEFQPGAQPPWQNWTTPIEDFVEGHLRLHDTRYWLFRAVGGHLARPTVPILCRVFYPNGTVPVLTGTRSNLPLLGGNEIHYISGLTARGIHHIISPEMFFLGVSAPTLVREDEEYYEEYYQYYRSLFRYPDSVRSNLADPSFNGFGSDPRIAALRERLLLSAASDLYNRRFLPELGYPWRPQYLDLARPDPRDDPPGHAEFMETLRNIHTPRPLFDNKESKTSDMVTKILAWCHENNRTFLDLAEGNDPNGEISTLLPELDGLIEFFDWTTMTFGEAKTLYRLLCHLRDRDQVVADRLFDDFHEAGQYLQGYYSSTMGNVGVVQFYITKYRMRKHLKEVFTRARNALLLALTDRRRFARQPPRDDATRIPWTHLDKLSSD